MITIDLRSDTSTLPPQEMLEVMRQARLGNDGYHEDPETNELEALAATMLEKEAGLLVPSGTMGNLVSLMSYLEPGDSFIVEEKAHVIRNESGYSKLLRTNPVTIASQLGSINPAGLAAKLQTNDSKKVKLVCTENTHGYYGGTVVPTRDSSAICGCAHSFGKPVHLDGSRIFNAATYLGVDVSEISRSADSVMFCLSKGLSAPIGSIIIGTKEFVSRAREQRKVLGGAMRQTGVIAAAGIWALNNMVKRLSDDHKHALILARGLAELASDGSFSLDLQRVQTNIVLVKTNRPELDAEALSKKLEPFGIKISLRDKNEFRCVTHSGVSEEQILYVLDTIRKIIRKGS